MKAYYDADFRLGILGGGQLGRMFIQEAINYNVNIAILDPSSDAPCSKIASDFVRGDFKDYETVLNFGRSCDVLTIEIEHVNVDALDQLVKEGKRVFPQPSVIRLIQDKGAQKQFYEANGIPTAPFHLVKDLNEVSTYVAEFPFMQKARTGGYDGRGVTPLRDEKDLETAFDAPSVLEQMVDFDQEISVIVARNENGEIKCFPTVGLEFNSEANLVEFLYSPANISEEVEQRSEKIAVQTAEALGVVGLLAVEMFLLKDGTVWVNEVAPRTHNSGHHTIEGNVTSQFEQHLRSILNLPLGDTSIVSPAVMLNVLGDKGYSGPVSYKGLDEVLEISGASVHLYGKTNTKPFRKMGHITITDITVESAIEKAKHVQSLVQVVSE